VNGDDRVYPSPRPDSSVILDVTYSDTPPADLSITCGGRGYRCYGK